MRVLSFIVGILTVLSNDECIYHESNSQLVITATNYLPSSNTGDWTVSESLMVSNSTCHANCRLLTSSHLQYHVRFQTLGLWQARILGYGWGLVWVVLDNRLIASITTAGAIQAVWSDPYLFNVTTTSLLTLRLFSGETGAKMKMVGLFRNSTAPGSSTSHYPATTCVSPTASATPSKSPTPTPTGTTTPTPTGTPTRSPTPTVLPTYTPTKSDTVTSTRTSTPSSTATLTTVSLTPSLTSTCSHTPTPTSTNTTTPTRTITPTNSASPTRTGSVSTTGSVTITPSLTSVPTHTGTLTMTQTGTTIPTISPTATLTSSVTITTVPTRTATPTATINATVTGTGSTSQSLTRTDVPTHTLTPTGTATASRTESTTSTRTPTSTSTRCPETMSDCGEGCVWKIHDRNNCGTCGHRCKTGFSCLNYYCVQDDRPSRSCPDWIPGADGVSEYNLQLLPKGWSEGLEGCSRLGAEPLWFTDRAELEEVCAFLVNLQNTGAVFSGYYVMDGDFHHPVRNNNTAHSKPEIAEMLELLGYIPRNGDCMVLETNGDGSVKYTGGSCTEAQPMICKRNKVSHGECRTSANCTKPRSSCTQPVCHECGQCIYPPKPDAEFGCYTDQYFYNSSGSGYFVNFEHTITLSGATERENTTVKVLFQLSGNETIDNQLSGNEPIDPDDNTTTPQYSITIENKTHSITREGSQLTWSDILYIPGTTFKYSVRQSGRLFAMRYMSLRATRLCETNGQCPVNYKCESTAPLTERRCTPQHHIPVSIVIALCLSPVVLVAIVVYRIISYCSEPIPSPRLRLRQVEQFVKKNRYPGIGAVLYSVAEPLLDFQAGNLLYEPMMTTVLNILNTNVETGDPDAIELAKRFETNDGFTTRPSYEYTTEVQGDPIDELLTYLLCLGTPHESSNDNVYAAWRNGSTDDPFSNFIVQLVESGKPTQDNEISNPASDETYPNTPCVDDAHQSYKRDNSTRLGTREGVLKRFKTLFRPKCSKGAMLALIVHLLNTSDVVEGFELTARASLRILIIHCGLKQWITESAKTKVVYKKLVKSEDHQQLVSWMLQQIGKVITKRKYNRLPETKELIAVMPEWMTVTFNMVSCTEVINTPTEVLTKKMKVTYVINTFTEVLKKKMNTNYKVKFDHIPRSSIRKVVESLPDCTAVQCFAMYPPVGTNTLLVRQLLDELVQCQRVVQQLEILTPLLAPPLPGPDLQLGILGAQTPGGLANFNKDTIRGWGDYRPSKHRVLACCLPEATQRGGITPVITHIVLADSALPGTTRLCQDPLEIRGYHNPLREWVVKPQLKPESDGLKRRQVRAVGSNATDSCYQVVSMTLPCNEDTVAAIYNGHISDSLPLIVDYNLDFQGKNNYRVTVVLKGDSNESFKRFSKSELEGKSPINDELYAESMWSFGDLCNSGMHGVQSTAQHYYGTLSQESSARSPSPPTYLDLGQVQLVESPQSTNAFYISSSSKSDAIDPDTEPTTATIDSAAAACNGTGNPSTDQHHKPALIKEQPGGESEKEEPLLRSSYQAPPEVHPLDTLGSNASSDVPNRHRNPADIVIIPPAVRRFNEGESCTSTTDKSNGKGSRPLQIDTTDCTSG